MENFMRRALELAQKADEKVKSNPKVGAVIVKHGQVIGEGYHQAFGSHHAEIHAFLNAQDALEGAEMYVTLEPCSHHGKTPSCAQAIIEKGIKKVYVATLDPNPLVSGKGIEMLKNAGIEVEVGMLKEESDALNQDFYHYITQKRPYITLKMALTLDGKYATHLKDSKWITSPLAREDVHKERSHYQAILVGIQTILEDDPSLNVRLGGEVVKTPIRIILDTHGKIPLHAKVCHEDGLTYVMTCHMSVEKSNALNALGVKVIYVKENEGHIDLGDMLDKLYELNIKSLLVEGGKTVHESFLKEKLAQKVIAYIAPKIVGGHYGINSPLVDYMTDAITLKNVRYEIIDQHIKIKGDL
jgi:diaminohydroxyphosphoribosylaminopyrimidine deaminase/5-amino-6-(5-phosphoribosylamino)uracil reductase